MWEGLRPNGNCPVFFYGDDGKFKQELAGEREGSKSFAAKGDGEG